MKKIIRPHHLLDNKTGFNVFSLKFNTVTSFGPNEKYQFKWSAQHKEDEWFPTYNISISVDGGQTWTMDKSLWSIYNILRQSSPDVGHGYHDKNSMLHKALIESRDIHNKTRRKKLDRERRKTFNALSNEEKLRVKKERSEGLKLRNEKIAQRKAKIITNIVNQIFQIGPELIRLKETIDEVLTVMSKGNIDRAFPYYYSRRRYINTAKWAVMDMSRHINSSHKRAEKNRDK